MLCLVTTGRVPVRTKMNYVVTKPLIWSRVFFCFFFFWRTDQGLISDRGVKVRSVLQDSLCQKAWITLHDRYRTCSASCFVIAMFCPWRTPVRWEGDWRDLVGSSRILFVEVLYVYEIQLYMTGWLVLPNYQLWWFIVFKILLNVNCFMFCDKDDFYCRTFYTEMLL